MDWLTSFHDKAAATNLRFAVLIPGYVALAVLRRKLLLRWSRAHDVDRGGVKVRFDVRRIVFLDDRNIISD